MIYELRKIQKNAKKVEYDPILYHLGLSQSKTIFIIFLLSIILIISDVSAVLYSTPECQCVLCFL